MAVIGLAVAFAALYSDVMLGLASDWATDDDFTHGFFVVPLALYFAWERRSRLTTALHHPSFVGLGVIVASVGLLLAGVLGAELFVSRISMIGVLAGTILFVWGWEHLRTLAFPLTFLVLMIPLPAIVLNEIVLPLQFVASSLGEQILDAIRIPALREGNVIVLANATLQVAEACSGIRSLITLLTAGVVLGYFMDSRAGVRLLLVMATIPIAILTNGLRVAGTGVVAYYYGPLAADRFFHGFSGWVVFLVAVFVLCALQLTVAWLARMARRPAANSASVNAG